MDNKMNDLPRELPPLTMNKGRRASFKVSSIDPVGQATFPSVNSENVPTNMESIETSAVTSSRRTQRESYGSSIMSSRRMSATPITSVHAGGGLSMSTVYAPPPEGNDIDDWGEPDDDDDEDDDGEEDRQHQPTSPLPQRSQSLSLTNTVGLNVDMTLPLNMIFPNHTLQSSDVNALSKSSKSDISNCNSINSIHCNISQTSSKALMDDVILAEMVYGHIYREMGRVLNQPNFNTGDPPRSHPIYMNPHIT